MKNTSPISSRVAAERRTFCGLLPTEAAQTYVLPSFKKDRVLVLGIGGGSDAIGAYAVAALLRGENPDAEVMYGGCINPKYTGFGQISASLFARTQKPSPDDKSFLFPYTLDLTLRLPQDDNGSPFLLVVSKQLKDGDIAQENAEAVRRSLRMLAPDAIFTVDCGGDSFAGSAEKDAEKGFDRRNLRAFQRQERPFTHIVLGPGCDGESEMTEMRAAVAREHAAGALLGAFDLGAAIDIMIPLSKHMDADRTPNIMRDAKARMKGNSEHAAQLQPVPRHKKPQIPLGWLTSALAFDGAKMLGGMQQVAQR